MTAQEAQRYARLAGLLLLISLVAGSYGESYIPPNSWPPTDIAETARRVASSSSTPRQLRRLSRRSRLRPHPDRHLLCPAPARQPPLIAHRPLLRPLLDDTPSP